MEEKYDYSPYTTVCTISLLPLSRDLTVYQMSNRTAEATSRYLPERFLGIPLEFYYNKENGNIIYNHRMIHHYKQHPPREKYIHVPSFVEGLYALYQRSCKGKRATQDDTALCSAISSFLTKVYPDQLSHYGKTSTTQYAFILPSHEYTDKNFINTTFRPLLQNTPWLTQNDSTSKTVFYSKLDTYAYLFNNITARGLCLARERKYLMCNLKRTSDYRRLVVTVNFIRAVYDPDLIAASGRSMTALGPKTMLSSKMISPSLSFEIPVEPTIAKLDKVAMFLYDKVFKGEEEDDSGPTQLEEYKADSTSLIHGLLYFISRPVSEDASNRYIDTDDFDDSAWWSNILSEKMKARLSSMTYGDVIQLFDDLDISLIESKIERYLQKYDDEETFESVVVMEGDDDDDELAEMETNPYIVHNLFFAKKHCQLFYWSRVKKAIIRLFQNQKKNKGTWGAFISLRDMVEGCACKVSEMLQLSNRLAKPIVMKSINGFEQESCKAPEIQKEKLALIEKIQPYGYYVEANINCSSTIEMLLNQVIETTAENGEMQRSTLSIRNLSHQASAMYDSIFDFIWSNAKGHLINSHYESLQQNGSIDLDSYKTIRAASIRAIKNSMQKKSNNIQDLDEVLYRFNTILNGKRCNFVITHRLVMDVGLLPYLRCIAGEIVAHVKSKAIFGNYKIVCLIVTGEFLYKWLEQGNSAYGEFIWSQLQEAIISELRKRQLRAHLMMKKSIILQDNDLNYQPCRAEKYSQVLNKQYYMKIIYDGKKKPRVYHDKGDHWVKIPFITQENDDLVWTIPLSPRKGKGRNPECSLEERFYVINDPEEDDQIYWETNLIAFSTAELNNEDDTSRVNVALASGIDFTEATMARYTFPIEVNITPCSYLSAIDLRLRMGIDAFAENDSIEDEQVAYPERLTLLAV